MSTAQPLTTGQRYLVFGCAMLAWMFTGILMAIPPLTTQSAVESMGVTSESLRGQWFSRYVAAFLLGAASGGLPFGWLGDRIGRAKALGFSVLTYSLLAGACYFVHTPEQLLVLWFLACLGVGGVWPNGVSLASEVFPSTSRPWLAGLFGTAANLGLMLMAGIAWLRPITTDDWRWVMQVAAAPALLGVIVLTFLPESPAWRNRRQSALSTIGAKSIKGEVFRPPLLKLTILGILLGTIPIMGNWGATNWMVPWAKTLQTTAGDNGLSAATQWYKSSGAAIGSLLGGWLASMYGRRTTYFFVSLISLSTSFYIFHFRSPLDSSFLTWVFINGFFGTIYFGWLPLYLPELFPTRVRATGTGVAFNWGRILTAIGVLMGGQLLKAFDGNYAQVGQWTCLIYAMGMVVICFAPDTTEKKLEE